MLGILDVDFSYTPFRVHIIPKKTVMIMSHCCITNGEIADSSDACIVLKWVTAKTGTADIMSILAIQCYDYV